jgi:GLPGLI family protein
MKTIYATVVLLAINLCLWAQSSDVKPFDAGSVFYQETVKFEIKVEGLPQEVIDQMPKERKMDKILLFNQSASLYKNSEKKTEEAQEMNAGHVNVRMFGKMPENKFFVDFQNKKIVEFQEFMGKGFLISDQQEIPTWKVVPEQKVILGYPCQKATYQKDSTTIEAWFTPLISVPSGPMGFGNLPGLILQLDNPKKKLSIVATKIDGATPDPAQLVAPTSGKKVTREEYKKIVADKMKEMQQQYGGSGNTIIIRSH